MPHCSDGVMTRRARRASLSGMRHSLLALLALPLAACASDRPSRADFVDFAELAPGAVIEARYATTENFVGARIDGYEARKCLLTREAGEALAKVERDLEQEGARLRIFDCYRPQRAVDHFVRWSEDPADVKNKARYYPNVPKAELFERGYIARKSGHSRGSTIDLTIDGLDMGGGWDLLGPLSHTMNEEVSAEAHANRLRLKAAMEKRGFVNYDKEWWHYTLAGEPYPDVYFDFPVK